MIRCTVAEMLPVAGDAPPANVYVNVVAPVTVTTYDPLYADGDAPAMMTVSPLLNGCGAEDVAVAVVAALVSVMDAYACEPISIASFPFTASTERLSGSVSKNQRPPAVGVIGSVCPLHVAPLLIVA